MLQERRQAVNRKPPQFQRLIMPLKMYTMFRPNDGFQLGVAVPLSQRFQCMASWIFSNKKAAEFEMTPMLMGTANPMDEDGMAFIQANSSSTGRIAATVQYPLSPQTKLSGELQMMDGTMAMTMGAFGVQQDWADCHL